MAESGSVLGLGQLILQQGLLSEEELNRCISIQKEKAKAGEFIRLGEILVREGLLSSDDIRNLLALQNRKIFVCQTCQSRFNTTTPCDISNLLCPRCNSPLTEPKELTSLKVEDTLLESREQMQFYPRKNKVFGNYEIIGEISRGGMGIVYKARQLGLNRIVALKVLLGGSGSDSEEVQRFIREAKAVSKLQHPNIIPIYEIGVVNDIHYFSMAYIHGIPLSQVMNKKIRSRDEILHIIVCVADAIQYAHEQGVIHRDIKPTNILIDSKQCPYLIDFGIAKFRWDRSNLTQKGVCMGSPAFIAPEYLRGETNQLDIQTDVYSLGVVIYQVLSGTTPYADDDTIKIINNVMFKTPPPIESLTKVEKDLATICNKGIARNPAHRYLSVKEFRDDIQRFLNGEEILARPRSIFSRLWTKLKKHYLLESAIVLFSLLISGGIYHFVSFANYQNNLANLNKELRDTKEIAGEGYIRAGEEMLICGKPKEALQILQIAIQLSPNSSKAYYLRSRAYLLLNLKDEAEVDLNKAISLDKK